MAEPIGTVTGPGGIRVDEIGVGPRVVLVHGGGAPGFGAFEAQLPLAARWRLVAPHRFGFAGSPDRPEDWEIDAPVVAELLGDGAHLVGASYGGTVALLAAARRPEAVRSLTLVEPSAISIAMDDPVVIEFERETRAALALPEPGDALRSLFSAVDPAATWPDPLTPPLEELGRRLQNMRLPQDAVYDAGTLAGGGFPIVVVTGGDRPPFESIAAALVRELGARHLVIAHGPHGTQHLGAPFNDLVERVWRDADAASSPPA
ncbi:MAG: alpha/beta fold hydrolase [Actinomycetota bacterium]